MPVVVLNNRDHKQLKVQPPADFNYLQNVHMLPLVMQECGHAGNEYPVVFTKKEGTEEFQLVAIFGLSAKSNLFVKDGQWLGLYMPAIIQNIPFKIINDANQPENMVLGLDTDSEIVSEEQGEALFDADGNETEFLQAMKESVGKYYEQDQMTQAAVKALKELDVLVECDLTVGVGDQRIRFDGVYTTDIVKLRELPDDTFIDLRNSDLLPLLYAQMFSINQFHRLSRLESASNTPGD